MTNLGEQFGRSLNNLLTGVKNLLLVCTNEDADFLAQGVLRGLGSFQGPSVALACFWNDRVRLEGTTDLSVELAPIVRKYVEPGECDAILVLKSIIASGCVVRTNITEIIHDRNPDRVLIFSPVVLKGADDRLQEEFDSDIARRFEFFWFAEDTETNDKGEVVPGVGGNVYERLGLGSEKIRYVPELVKERRVSAKSLGRPLQLPVTQMINHVLDILIPGLAVNAVPIPLEQRKLTSEEQFEKWLHERYASYCTENGVTIIPSQLRIPAWEAWEAGRQSNDRLSGNESFAEKDFTRIHAGREST